MRKRYLLLLVTAAIGLALVWVDRYTRDINSQEVEQRSQEPDYYGDDLVSRRFNDKGQLSDTFYAATSKHYPANDITIFKAPRVVLTGQDQWVVTAQEGILEGNSDALKLSGSIVIKALNNSAPWLVETESLTYFIDRQFATSDALVTIYGEHTVMRFTGMTFYAPRQRMDLKTVFRTHYVPAK